MDDGCRGAGRGTRKGSGPLFRVPGLLLALAVVGAGTAARAQPADTLITEATELARFTQARALALDAAGMLYVVDAGLDAVVQLAPDGRRVATYGGPGAEAGQFVEPSDIDPTNGLVWIVADAGNHRLQRFSRTFTHLESIPVIRADGAASGQAGPTVALSHRAAGQERADGRPVAVATSPAGETFAAEEARGVVLKWDASRRLERVIGGMEAGEGRLVEPVALAADARTLYVADRGQAAVIEFDLFGSYVRTLAPGRAEDIQGVTVVEEALWVVLPNRLLVYHTRGRLEAVADVVLG